MKSRISCFDTATFKKDITRFAPLWALYTVNILLTILPTMSVGNLLSGYVRMLDGTLGPLQSPIFCMLHLFPHCCLASCSTVGCAMLCMPCP